MRVVTCVVLVTLVTAADAQQKPAPVELGPASRGVNFYSLEKEAALGKGLAAEFEKQVRLLDSPSGQKRVEEIVARLAAAFPEKPFPYTVRLVAGDSSSPVHESSAFPGGYLYVPESLLREAQSDAELAGMLAHSMAHIVARHGTRQATRAELVHLATVPLIYMGGWQGYGGDALVVPLGFIATVRRHEFQADLLAVAALARAGYDPAAFVAYLRRIQPEKPPGINSTMPPKQERLAALEAAIR